MQKSLSIQDAVNAVQAKLYIKHQHLHSLLQVTEAINHNYSTDNLVLLYQKIIQEQLGVEEMAFFIFNDIWKRKIWLKDDDQDVFIPIAKHIEQYSELKILTKEEQKLFFGFKYIIPVFHKENAIAFVLLGDIKLEHYFKEDELLEFAQIITNIIAVAVENKRLFKREVEKKEYDKELELASNIQGMLIPKKLPKNNLYEFDGIYLPHKGIGGDYYDVIHINKDEFVFCIADISGKGISAALVMANIQAYLNATLDMQMSTQELILKLNKKIYSITNGDKYVTLFLAKYNIMSRMLTYVNCGHVPPILFNQHQLIKLDEGTTMLGAFENLPKLKIQNIQLEKDSTIICFTDGLTELENEENEQFEEAGIIDFIQKNKNYPPSLFNKVLYDYLSKFKRNVLFNDDVSILTGKFF
ncbi:MAG: SpoIIE family protein phosphatase [Sphingobacteriales bacterium]|nr:MAG: SpoIIE family protein phosphatase [Sphingobacteriales bacterium]